MFPAARIGDAHVCPLVTPGLPPIPHVGLPLVMGVPTVLVCAMPQSVVGSICPCIGPPDAVAKGSMTVLVGGIPAARLTDLTAHGGVIMSGAPTVLIGG